MTELLGLRFSPWTEKARWALDVRRVPYTFRHYQPLIGEPALRLKLRRLTGRVTVPVLTLDDGRVLADSADIARWADGRGEGPRLFPAEHEAAIAASSPCRSAALAAGRALSLRRMLADDEALAEMVPGLSAARSARRRAHRGPASPGRSASTTATATAPRRTGAPGRRPRRDPRRARQGRLRQAPRTLLGRFTFADIAMAQVLVSVEPPAFGLKLGAASRRSFTDPELRERYADLVAWRDELYLAFRYAGDHLITPRPSRAP